jgi:hypothetical protein
MPFVLNGRAPSGGDDTQSSNRDNPIEIDLSESETMRAMRSSASIPNSAAQLSPQDVVVEWSVDREAQAKIRSPDFPHTQPRNRVLSLKHVV